MAVEPIRQPVEHARPRLAAFHPDWGERVAGWVRDPREAYWLAPRTAPPITADKIRSWEQMGRQQLVLLADGGEPVAYGELNVLNLSRRSWWLGHLIVDPQQRGRGYGKELTRRLLDRAFDMHAARSVTLVVFEENVAAVAAYRAVGMRPEGHEDHHFAAYGRVERLLRMTKLSNW